MSITTQLQQRMHNMEGQEAWSIQGVDETGAMSGATLDAVSEDNDNWSTSLRSGPTAPTTLNVED